MFQGWNFGSGNSNYLKALIKSILNLFFLQNTIGPFSTLVHDEQTRRNFVNTTVDFILQNGFDGFGTNNF